MNWRNTGSQLVQDADFDAVDIGTYWQGHGVMYPSDVSRESDGEGGYCGRFLLASGSLGGIVQGCMPEAGYYRVKGRVRTSVAGGFIPTVGEETGTLTVVSKWTGVNTTTAWQNFDFVAYFAGFAFALYTANTGIRSNYLEWDKLESYKQEEISGVLLEGLQEAIKAYLAGQEELTDAGIEVISRKESDVDAIIEEKILKGIGVGIIVLYPFPTKIIPSAPGPVCEEISIQIQITEKVITNQTGKSALYLAERIMQWLHLWLPTDVEGINSAIIVEENDPLIDPPTLPGRNEIIVKLRCSGAMQILN